MSAESVPAMSREEFDALFASLLDCLEDWKLSSVLLHMRDVIGERVGSRRAARHPRNRSKLTKAEKRERSTLKQIARKSTYNAYITSQTWYNLRDKILDRDGHKCLCCGHPASEVHHRSYAPKVMAGKDNAKLASICSMCHRKVHFNDDGSRVKKRETESRFLELVETKVSIRVN